MKNVIIVANSSKSSADVASFLKQIDDIHLVGIVNHEDELFLLLNKHKIHNLLLDIREENNDGMALINKVKSKYPLVQIHILSTLNNVRRFSEYVSNEVNGYFLKEQGFDQIALAIQFVQEGQVIMPQQLLNELVNEVQSKKQLQEQFCNIDLYEWDRLSCELTNQEKRIAIMLANGYTNAEISANLFLSIGTTKNYVSRLFRKLKVSNRSEAMLLLRRWNIK